MFFPTSGSTSPVPLFRSYDSHISCQIIVDENLQIRSEFLHLSTPQKKHAVAFDFRHTVIFRNKIMQDTLFRLGRVTQSV